MSGETIGIVDVGGGYRGIYASGVLDYCMDHRLQFDVGVGVSAGSANLISYAAGQRGRNFQFYSEYGLRKEYADIRNFLFKRSFLDLDYVYGTLNGWSSGRGGITRGWPWRAGWRRRAGC